MCGCVGEDIFGDANIKSMQENGVDTDLITKTNKCATATGCVTVTEDGYVLCSSSLSLVFRFNYFIK